MSTSGKAGYCGDTPSNDEWWPPAVVHQVYIRSFADGHDDGDADLGGLSGRLPHLRELGVDAIWVNPLYPSRRAGARCDITDYSDIERDYGTLAEADVLIAEAHAAGLRVILDIVPTHTSSEHAWFQAALAGDADARARYIFRAGRGANGRLPPNDWTGNFGAGPAWSRTTEPDGEPGEWYLHLFAPEQPDLEWDNPFVRAEFEDILRFWFDRDVDGFRIAVDHGLANAPELPDSGDPGDGAHRIDPHAAWDHKEVHETYRAWRKIADSYDPPRIFVEQSWVANNERLALYLRPDESQTAFQFDFQYAHFEADFLPGVIEEAREQAGAVGEPSRQCSPERAGYVRATGRR